MKHLNRSMIILATALLLAACASGHHGHAARDGVCDDCGTIVDADRVYYKEQGIGLGAVIGGLAGAALGSQVGDGSGQKVATVAGAAAGAYAGHKVQESRREEELAWQFEVRLDDGRYATVTQIENPYNLGEGDRVEIEGDEVVPL